MVKYPGGGGGGGGDGGGTWVGGIDRVGLGDFFLVCSQEDNVWCLMRK